MLDALLQAVPWRAERRRMYDRVVDVPRLVAWYSSGTALPHPVLADARAALSAYYAMSPCTTPAESSIPKLLGVKLSAASCKASATR